MTFFASGWTCWYRNQVREVVAPLRATWQKELGVATDRLFIQRMRTRWGRCNPTARSIRLNTDLAKKPVECLEFILVHELLHLIERLHNERFTALIDKCRPNWQQRRALLNRLPVRHEDWVC
jgi:predicted metal-dependent hydrolase